MKTPIEYLKESWVIYTKKENFIFFSKVMAVLVIVSTGLSYLINYFYPVNVWEDLDFSNIPMLIGFIIFSLISLILGLWVQSTTYVAIVNKPTNDIKSIFLNGFKYSGRYFLISLMFGLIMFVGMVLLIIPAIIFAVWFSFSTFLVFDKNLKTKEALSKSKALVKGKFLKVLGRFIVFVLVILLVQIILSAIPYVGYTVLSFIAPIFIIPFYLLYKDLLATD